MVCMFEAFMVSNTIANKMKYDKGTFKLNFKIWHKELQKHIGEFVTKIWSEVIYSEKTYPSPYGYIKLFSSL